jgi:hypothetical protein
LKFVFGVLSKLKFVFTKEMMMKQENSFAYEEWRYRDMMMMCHQESQELILKKSKFCFIKRKEIVCKVVFCLFYQIEICFHKRDDKSRYGHDDDEARRMSRVVPLKKGKICFQKTK